MVRVLIIANSRTTKGGITTVLKIWERMPFWKEFRCKWVETQINASIWRKLYYMFSSYFICAFIVPFYSIVHFHSAPGVSSIVQMPIFLWSMLWRKKIIMHLHVGNQLLDYKNDGLFKFILRHSDRTIVLANIWREELIKQFKEANNVEVIYNPSPEVAGISPNRKNIVLFAAYLAPNKGYDLVIHAFNKVKDIHPDWHLLIAGAGEIEKAKSLVKKLAIDDFAQIIGWQSPEQMKELYQKAKIYCIASYQEGFPMSAIECWANGTTLVTTPVGGLVDVLKNRENCLLFDFGNVDQLSTCFLELMENENLRNYISENSKQMAVSLFSINTINQQLRDLYINVSSTKLE